MNRQKQEGSEVLGVVIHAFYTDVFVNIIHSLKNSSVQIKAYVTTTAENESEVEQILNSSGFDFYLLPVVNRGRDVLPFLMVMPKVIQGGHEIMLKLHTKKTTHRSNGNAWMDDILAKLIENDNMGKCFSFMKSNNGIGMVAPAGHLLQIGKYLGSNRKNIFEISKKLGFSKKEVEKQPFSAGTMFHAHVSAIKLIMDLALTVDDFEMENEQIDGTLAHALERCFSISCLAANLKIISSDMVEGNNLKVVMNDYAYADTTTTNKPAYIMGLLSYYFRCFRDVLWYKRK